LDLEREPSSRAQSSLWPLSLLGILFSFLAILSWVKSKTNQAGETVHPQDSTRHKGTSSPKQPLVVANIPPTPAQHTQPYRREEHTPGWKKLIEITAVVTGLGLLIVTVCQLRSAVKSTRTAQRAWMIPAGAEFIDFEIGKLAKVRCDVKNNGATPAVDAVIEGSLDHWLTGQVAPNRNDFRNKPTQWKGALVRSGGGVALTSNLLKVDNTVIQQVHSGQMNIRMYGKTFYDDVFGHHHWVTFCSEYDEESGAFVTCDEGNQMDTDAE
jgi:hypothetical protein